MNDVPKIIRFVFILLRGLLTLPFVLVVGTPYMLIVLMFDSVAKRLGIRKTTMILSAATECNLSKLHQGLNNGEDINAFNKIGDTALHKAAMCGYSSFVREACELGCRY